MQLTTETSTPRIAPAAAEAAGQLEQRPSYRPEMQGLRAISILMVVVYHIWFGRVSGGVDIFLLISAFLLTGSFTRKLETGRPLQVPRYWLKTFKRLVPPAAVVILATLVGVLVVLPTGRLRELLSEALASLFYVENWLLAFNSVDYYAADHSTASPFQHFWSLSIQGQVFVLWPVLFALGGLIAHRFRLPVRKVLLGIFGLVFVVSFAWSVYFTVANQSFAYFDTRTRAWEFALGSLLALVLPAIEQRVGYRQVGDPSANAAQGSRIVLGWLGLGLILSAGFVLDIEGGFPGWIALWPTGAALLVIACGPTQSRIGVDRLLSTRPLLWLGEISYALYLVHWPLLVLGLVVLEKEQMNYGEGAVVIGLSILLAWGLTRFVDSPIRRSAWLDARKRRSGVVIVVGAALVTTAVLGTGGALDRREAKALAQAEVNNPGARSLAPGFEVQGDPSALTLPLLANIDDDWYEGEENCRGEWADAGNKYENCSMTPGSGSNADKTIVVLGNSRTQQLAPSIATLADDHGWTVVKIHRPGCEFGFGPGLSVDGDWCHEHNESVLADVVEKSPEAVMTSTSFIGQGNYKERLAPGIEHGVNTLTAAGIDVLGYRDFPRLTWNPRSCLEEGRDCSEPLSNASPEDPKLEYLAEDPNAALAAEAPGPGRVVPVDVLDQICPDRTCHSEIGNVAVWLDSLHITAFYSSTLDTAVQADLDAAGWSW